MDCAHIVDTLADRSAGLLPSEKEAALRAHLLVCPACAAESRAFEKSMRLLAFANSPTPPENLWLGVRARIELERSVTSYTTIQTEAPHSPPWWTSVLTAGAGFLTVMGIVTLSNRMDSGYAPQDPPPAVVSVSQTNSLDVHSPFADPASIDALDTLALRRLPNGKVYVIRKVAPEASRPVSATQGDVWR
jgi:predicted anti-sigma-YlaC factor YlaD